MRPCPRPTRLPRLAIGVVAGAFCLAVAGGGTSAAQVTGQCAVAVNGVDASRASSTDGAIEIDARDQLNIVAITAVPVSRVLLEAEFGPFTSTLADEAVSSQGTSLRLIVPVADHARYGIGLYRVRASADGCTAVAWIRITGRSPWTTVAGVTGAVLLAIGLVLQALGVVRASRGGGWAAAALGGIPTGIGAVVLAHQFGLTPITTGGLALWIGAPMAAGAIGRTAVAAIGGGGAQARPPDMDRSIESSEGGEGWARAEPPSREGELATANGGGGPPPAAPTAAASAPPPASFGAASPTGEDTRDPPRSAYARLDADDTVVGGEEFALTTGLSPTPTPGVAGPAIERPASSVGPYTLGIQVVADGFTLRAGETWTHELRVTYEHPYPAVDIHLTPEAPATRMEWRPLRAIYSVEGQTIGMAERIVAVVADRAAATDIAPREQDAGTDIAIPTAETAPDLTVRIELTDESSGRLLWTFDSPHPDVKALFPDQAVSTDIGPTPDVFARELIDKVRIHEGRSTLYELILGVGNSVADEMPQAFHDAFREVVARVAPRPPTVLILSREPFVPWELGAVDALADPEAPPLLAAQADVGRWVLGHRRPKLPPPPDLTMRSMAVIAGAAGGTWPPLPDAEAEAGDLQLSFGATAVRPTDTDVVACIKGTPQAEVLHFAVHGAFDPPRGQIGVVLEGGAVLDPLVVRGTTMAGRPFVFLNACQVGSGNQVLGDYSGMAAAFLYAGASGVVAPLWSIGDTLAREIAVRFYDEAFSDVSPAAVLRAERAKFRDSSGPSSATSLAYQFFGHPGMKLRRG
ncbi:MAG: CHAT domain-containing protein [Actinobacteria bacterium]|nr:CHAT domain-containing protein [Actinomycetota bacterium]